MKIRVLTVASIAIAIAACTPGGSGGKPGQLPQNTSPVITDPGPLTVPENTAAVTTLTVTDAEGNAVSLSLSGDDAGAFSITSAGVLSFLLPPDFENPGDMTGDNIYQVTVTASDTYTPDNTVDLTVEVTDDPNETFPMTWQGVSQPHPDAFVNANILSSFEFPGLIQSDTAKFDVTGAFADPAIAAGGWNNLAGNADAAWIGDASVTTCEIGGGNCDGPQGSILIKDVVVNKGSITFLMSGGSGANNVGVEVILSADDSVLATYTPNSCGDAYLKGDQHYVHFETSGLIGTTIDVRIFDEESGGCGFVAFDHFYQTDTPQGPSAGSVSAPLNPVNVTSEPAAITGLIPQASFETPVDMIANRGWVGTGAFANPTNDTWWEGTARASNGAAARLGNRAISTCEINDNAAGCDAPVGTLTSPSFTVTDNFINFLMSGGNGGAPVGLNLLDGAGNVIHTYTPNSCGPSHIDGDNDWVWIDVSALAGASIKLQAFDNEAGGCGFLSFDHFYQGPAAWDPGANGTDGGTVALTPAVEANLGFNVSLPDDAFVQVIGNFDDATTNNWTATGDFLNPAGADAWRGTSGEARVGIHAVSTCELNNNANGCDAPTGTLTSPGFTVDAARPYLNFLMAGGNGAAPVGLRVLDMGGTEIASFMPNSCGPSFINGDDDWVSIDLTAEAGNMVQVEIFDNEPGGCGFVSWDHVHMSATQK
jgi:hypothetical protein